MNKLSTKVLVKIKDLKNQNNSLVELVSDLAMVMGGDPTDPNLSVAKEFIKEHYQEFSVEEFKSAFDLYAMGKLGEIQYTRITPVTIGKVMTLYFTYIQENNARNQAKISQNAKINTETYNEADVSAIMNEALQNAIQEFVKTGNVKRGFHIYDWLDEQGKFDFSVEEKKVAFDRAKEIQTDEETAEIKYGLERKRMKNLVQKIIDGQSGRTHRIAKNILLIKYIKNLLNQKS